MSIHLVQSGLLTPSNRGSALHQGQWQEKEREKGEKALTPKGEDEERGRKKLNFLPLPFFTHFPKLQLRDRKEERKKRKTVRTVSN